MPNYEHGIMDKMAFLTGEQQERVLRFIEDIEAKEPLTKLMIVCWIEPFKILYTAKYLGKKFSAGISVGEDLVGLFVAYMKDSHHLLIGRPTAQKVIEEIGSILPLAPELTFNVKGRNLDTGLPDSIEITSIQVREIIHMPLEHSINTFAGNVKYIPRNMELPDDVLMNATIHIRGDYAYIKGVAEAVQKATGLAVID